MNPIDRTTINDKDGTMSNTLFVDEELRNALYMDGCWWWPLVPTTTKNIGIPVAPTTGRTEAMPSSHNNFLTNVQNRTNNDGINNNKSRVPVTTTSNVPSSSLLRESPTCVVTTWTEHEEGLARFDNHHHHSNNNNNKQCEGKKQRTFPLVNNNNNDDDDDEMTRELRALRQALHDAESRRERLQDTVRAQRQRVTALQEELRTARATVQRHRTSLVTAVAQVSASRDAFRCRWKDQIAVNKTLHEALAVARAQCRRQEQCWTQQTTLLELYRKLSKLTGYQQLGKEIRIAEAEWAAALSKLHRNP